MISVKATREGLINEATASGYIVEKTVPFVALPSKAALHLWVRVANPLTGKSIRALVKDIGPHYTNDHAYVFQDATIPGYRGEGDTTIVSVVPIRPKAERNKSSNHAGIDLSEAVWVALGMKDNTMVDWEFL